jgi:endonuclease/exonuclease/phosphatase family metal-dependent hydrolase
VTDWQVLRLPPLPIKAPIWPEWRRLRLVQDEARVALGATVQAPGGELLVMTTHLSFLRGWNVVQLRRVMRAVGTGPGPAVVMGDLNMGPRVVRAVTGLDPLVRTVTFPAERPSRQIDHIVGRGLPPAVHGEASVMSLSDHRALLVDVAEP